MTRLDQPFALSTARAIARRTYTEAMFALYAAVELAAQNGVGEFAGKKLLLGS